MAGNLPDTIENQLLDALVGTISYTVTTPRFAGCAWVKT